MPNTHYAVSWVDSTAVNKSNIRDGFRDYVPIQCSVAQLQALTTAGAKWAMTNGGLYAYDSADTTTADDGVNCIVTADSKRFKLIVRTAPHSISVTDNTNAGLTVTQAGTGNVATFNDAASDTTPVIIDAAGKFVIGHTAALGLTAIGSTPNKQQIASGSGVGAATYALLMFSTTAVPQILIGRSNNNTIGSHTAVTSGQQLGLIRGIGSDGSDFFLATSIQSLADAAASTGIVPGRLSFQTANASGTVTEAVRIDSSQNVKVGAGATPAVKLDVDGPVRVKSYTVGTVPAAATAAGQIIYVSNDANGAVLGFSDGSIWRRVTDRTQVA